MVVHIPWTSIHTSHHLLVTQTVLVLPAVIVFSGILLSHVHTTPTCQKPSRANFIILPFGDENLSWFCQSHDCQSDSLTLPQKFRSIRSSCVPLSNTGQICRTPFSSHHLSPLGFRGTRTTIPHCSRSCPGRRGKLSFPSSVMGTARF